MKPLVDLRHKPQLPVSSFFASLSPSVCVPPFSTRPALLLHVTVSVDSSAVTLHHLVTEFLAENLSNWSIKFNHFTWYLCLHPLPGWLQYDSIRGSDTWNSFFKRS